MLLVYKYSYTQDLTQTVRETILDKKEQFPLIGATVAICNRKEEMTTDKFGKFRLKKISLGRDELIIVYL